MKHISMLVCVILLASLAVAGCETRAMKRAEPPSDVVTAGRGGESPSPRQGMVQEDLDPAQEKAKKQGIERKIIYTGDINLKVADFAMAEQELQQIILTHQGIIASADVSGSAGGMRAGIWKIRIAVPKFGEFREAVKKLGELERFTSNAQDVTEEYYDLQVRINSKEEELATYRNLLKGVTKTEEVIPVLKEVNRATEELERMKGRQRVLENLTELTTVTVHIQERGAFTPNEPTAFGTQIGDTFSKSVDLLVGVGKALVLAVAALTPWSPLFVILGGVLWWVTRRPRTVVAAVAAVKPPEVPKP